MADSCFCKGIFKKKNIEYYYIFYSNHTDTNQNSIEYELKNDQKCFDFGYLYSIVLLYFSPRAFSLFAYSSANGSLHVSSYINIIIYIYTLTHNMY